MSTNASNVVAQKSDEQKSYDKASGSGRRRNMKGTYGTPSLASGGRNAKRSKSFYSLSNEQVCLKHDCSVIGVSCSTTDVSVVIPYAAQTKMA